jgi:hypothetical protein
MPTVCVGRHEALLYTRDGEICCIKVAIRPASCSGRSSGEKVLRPFDHLEARAGDDLGQALPMLEQEEAIVLGPGHQRRALPGHELEGGDRMACVEARKDPPQVAPHLSPSEHRKHIRVLGIAVDRFLREPPVRDRQAPRRTQS